MQQKKRTSEYMYPNMISASRLAICSTLKKESPQDIHQASRAK